MKGNAVVSTMNFLENDLYKEDIAYVAGFELSWHMLQNKSILISGASFEGLNELRLVFTHIHALPCHLSIDSRTLTD